MGDIVSKLAKPLNQRRRTKHDNQPLLPITDWKNAPGPFGLEDGEDNSLFAEPGVIEFDLDINRPVDYDDRSCSPVPAPVTMLPLTLDAHPFFRMYFTQSNRYVTQNSFVSASCSFEVSAQVGTSITIDHCSMNDVIQALLLDESVFPFLVDTAVLISTRPDEMGFPTDIAVGLRIPTFRVLEMTRYASQKNVLARAVSLSSTHMVDVLANRKDQPFDVTQHFSALMAPSEKGGTLRSDIDALEKEEWKHLVPLQEPDYDMDVRAAYSFPFTTIMSFLGGYSCAERFQHDYFVQDSKVYIRDRSDLHYFLCYFAMATDSFPFVSSMVSYAPVIRPGRDNRSASFWACSLVNEFYWIFAYLEDLQQKIPLFQPKKTALCVTEIKPKTQHSSARPETIHGRIEFTVCLVPIQHFARSDDVAPVFVECPHLQDSKE